MLTWERWNNEFIDQRTNFGSEHRYKAIGFEKP
jgi:hypothetical protein